MENLKISKLSKSDFLRNNWKISGQYVFEKAPIIKGESLNQVASVDLSEKNFIEYGLNWKQCISAEETVTMSWNTCVVKGTSILAVYDQYFIYTDNFGSTWNTGNKFASWTGGDIDGSTIVLVQKNGNPYISTNGGLTFFSIEYSQDSSYCKVSICGNKLALIFDNVPGIHVYENEIWTIYDDKIFNDLKFCNDILHLTSLEGYTRTNFTNTDFIVMEGAVSLSVSDVYVTIISKDSNFLNYSQNGGIGWSSLALPEIPQFVTCSKTGTIIVSSAYNLIEIQNFSTFYPIKLNTDDIFGRFLAIPVYDQLGTNLIVLTLGGILKYNGGNFTPIYTYQTNNFLGILECLLSNPNYYIQGTGNEAIAIKNSATLILKNGIWHPLTTLGPIIGKACATISGNIIVVCSPRYMNISLDDGSTWTKKGLISEIKYCSILSNGNILAVSNKTIFIYRKNGILSSYSNFETNTYNIVIAFSEPHLFILTSVKAIYTSDYGLTYFKTEIVNPPKVCSFNSSTFYYISKNYLYKIDDYTNDSQYTTPFLTLNFSADANILSFLVNGTSMYFSYDSKFYYSEQLNSASYQECEYYVDQELISNFSSNVPFISGNGNNIFAIDDNLKIYKIKQDNEFSIYPIASSQVFNLTNISKVAMSSSGQYQSIVTFSGGLITSRDYGRTWVRISQPSYTFYSYISISGSGKYQIAISFIFPYMNFNVNISENYGITFQKYDLHSEVLISCACSFSGKYIIIVSLLGILFVSKDYGKNWTSINLKSLNPTVLLGSFVAKQCFVSESGKYQRVLGISGDIFGSDDYGKNWKIICKINSVFFFGGMSGDGKFFTIQSIYGIIYVSDDYGYNFNAINASAENFISNVAISSNGQFQLLCSDSLYISTDYGGTFRKHKSIEGIFLGLCCNSTGSILKAISADGTIYECLNHELLWNNLRIQETRYKNFPIVENKDYYNVAVEDEEVILELPDEQRQIIIVQESEKSEKYGVTIIGNVEKILLYPSFRVATLTKIQNNWILKNSLPKKQIKTSDPFAISITDGYADAEFTIQFQEFTIQFQMNINNSSNQGIMEFTKDDNFFAIYIENGEIKIETNTMSASTTGFAIGNSNIVISRNSENTIRIYVDQVKLCEMNDWNDIMDYNKITLMKAKNQLCYGDLYYLKISNFCFDNPEKNKYNVDFYSVLILKINTEDILLDSTRKVNFTNHGLIIKI